LNNLKSENSENENNYNNINKNESDIDLLKKSMKVNEN